MLGAMFLKICKCDQQKGFQKWSPSHKWHLNVSSQGSQRELSRASWDLTIITLFNGCVFDYWFFDELLLTRIQQTFIWHIVALFLNCWWLGPIPKPMIWHTLGEARWICGFEAPAKGFHIPDKQQQFSEQKLVQLPCTPPCLLMGTTLIAAYPS
jgi:hypothetical protein